MRTITRAALALGFVGAMAFGTPNTAKAQIIIYEGPGVGAETFTDSQHHRYSRHDRYYDHQPFQPFLPFAFHNPYYDHQRYTYRDRYYDYQPYAYRDRYYDRQPYAYNRSGEGQRRYYSSSGCLAGYTMREGVCRP